VKQKKEVAEAVAGMLAEQGWTLGTIECGIEGVVGHHLFDTEEGPSVLGDSLTVPTVEEAIDFLELPWQQFAKAGDFSVKAARAAARVGRAFLGVDLCLAVWAQPLPAEAATIHEAVHLALDTGQKSFDETVKYDGSKAGMGDWLAEQALELVHRALA
jgi:nicotinamide mononucleotide (NMN) deamidase PncC